MKNTEIEECSPDWLMGGNPKAIEAQEARGQQEFINSELLPIKIFGNGKEKLEKMGVIFKKPVDGDPMFIKVVLPAGWRKEATNHVMWSSLVDSHGKVIADIFYKAAFYDRKAILDVVC